MTVGIYIIIILILGYFSVYLRERYLNLKWLVPFTWLGIFIHESAHALFCLLTGGKVINFHVTAREGYITHFRPRVPVIGPLVTAIAPLIFSLIIIGILNHFWLKTSLCVTSFNIWENFINVVYALNPLTWPAWELLIIFLNIGVMMGPSVEDLKSIWLLVLLSFFIHSQSLAQVLSLVIAMIIVNVILFLLILLIKYFFQRRKGYYRVSHY